MRRRGIAALVARCIGAAALMACALLALAQPLPLPICPMRPGLAMAPAAPSSPARSATPAAAPSGATRRTPAGARRDSTERSDRGRTPFDGLPHPCGCFGQCVAPTPVALPAPSVALRADRLRATMGARVAAGDVVPPRRVDLRQPLATAPPISV